MSAHQAERISRGSPWPGALDALAAYAERLVAASRGAGVVDEPPPALPSTPIPSALRPRMLAVLDTVQQAHEKSHGGGRRP